MSAIQQLDLCYILVDHRGLDRIENMPLFFVVGSRRLMLQISTFFDHTVILPHYALNNSLHKKYDDLFTILIMYLRKVQLSRKLIQFCFVLFICFFI